MLIGIVVVILIVGVVLTLTFGGENIKIGDSKNDDIGGVKGSVSLEGGGNNFEQFGAEIVCLREEYTEAMDDVSSEERAVLRNEYQNNILVIAEEYGFDEDGMENFGRQYEEDTDYARAVVEIVKDLCPEAAAELEQNLAIVDSGMSVKVTINEVDDFSVIEYKYYEDGYIESNSDFSTANMDDIEATIRAKFGDELGEQAIAIAQFIYE